MNKPGAVDRQPAIAVERFTARDELGTLYRITRWRETFRVLEQAGWSAPQHIETWQTADGIEVMPQKDGSLLLQTDPPTRLQR